MKKESNNPIVNHQRQVQSFENSMGEVMCTCKNFSLNFKLSSILCSCSKNDKGMPQIHSYRVNVLRQNTFFFLSRGNLLCVSDFECSRDTSHDIHYYQPINPLVTPQGISAKGWRTILTEGMPQCNEKMFELSTFWPLHHMGSIAWEIRV